MCVCGEILENNDITAEQADVNRLSVAFVLLGMENVTKSPAALDFTHIPKTHQLTRQCRTHVSLT